MHIRSDDELDRLLREIAVPGELAARLKGITIPSDDELDEQLCGVIMPESICMALHAIPGDEGLDNELQEVAAPYSLRSQLQFKTPDQRWREASRWLLQGTVAALLFLAVSATLFTSGAAFLTSVFPPKDSEPQWVVLASGPETWSGEQIDSPAIEEGGRWSPDEAVLVSTTQEVEVPKGGEMLLPNWDESLVPTAPTGAVAQWQSLLRHGLRPWDDVVLLRWGLLGAPQYAEDELPELTRIRLPSRSGLELPAVTRGYDRRFWLKEGIFPPVDPSGHAKLVQLDIPLNTSSAALDLTETALAAGKLPNPDEIRAEQFMAALESRFPKAPVGKLALSVQGAPSPFGPSDSLLLHVGAQAGKLRRLSPQPTHLVIAIDTSASMARGRKLEMVRQAVEQAHRQLGPRDFLSLVAFDEEVVCRVEHLSAAQRDDLHDQLNDLLPRGGTNLAAGLQSAAAASLNEPAALAGISHRRRLVLITDSRAAMPDDTAEKIAEVLTLISEEGVGLDVLDVSGRSTPDPLLQHWTQQLAGTYRSIASRKQLYASLVESLAGHNPAVASEATVRIKFEPKVVAAYRLIGHETNMLAQVMAVAPDAQLLPEECAGALVEVWLKPGVSPSEALGDVIISWKNPHTGTKESQKLKLDRKVFASSFSETPLSFQTAAVAAEIAEQFRGSREALRTAGLFSNLQNRNNAATIKTAIRSWSTIRQEPDVRRLLTALEQLEKIRGR
jgi:Ca-activated chloride channel family protein